ncbi:hypothetical protein PTKIN_Ptkin14bG0025500 [Pterospermum kingtungense]
MGLLMFNVDGSSQGKPGPAGIGGVLRDHMGKELIRFLKSIEIKDSNMAELLAIEKLLFGRTIWVLNPVCAGLKERNFINHTESLKIQLIESRVRHIFREANHIADWQAKEGVMIGDHNEIL